MASILFSEVRKGMVVNMEGQLYYCVDRELRTPGNLPSKLTLKLKNIKTDDGVVLMHIKGIDTVEAAEAMRNKVLHLDREDVELPEDLVFIQDILGFKVFDLRVDRVIGRIRDVLTSNPAHDMYEIAGEDGRLIYIPAIKPFLKEIDMEAGVIYVESIEGLIE